MRSCLLLGLGLSAFSSLAGATAEPPSAKTRPNILLITIDTLRADHLSSYGYHLKTSPTIDKLAEDGVRFENAYSPIPLTGPSHTSLFTSRFPQEHGARINGYAVPKDSKWLSLPQVLKRFGYQNGAFVSAWPLTARLTHLDRWFDLYDEDLGRKYQVFNSSRYAEDVTPLAVSWLEENQVGPFFLWVHYFDPHSPYNLREEFAEPERSGHPKSTREPLNPEMANSHQEIRLRDRLRGLPHRQTPGAARRAWLEGIDARRTDGRPRGKSWRTRLCRSWPAAYRGNRPYPIDHALPREVARRQGHFEQCFAAGCDTDYSGTRHRPAARPRPAHYVRRTKLGFSHD